MARYLYFNTAINGGSVFYYTNQNGFTLSQCRLSAPEPITTYVDVPGRFKGPLDLSEALTDGEIRYNNREFTATIECSEGTRAERANKLKDLYYKLEGRLCDIKHPDFPNYHLKGRVRLSTEVHDLAHTIVGITAVCEPWFYGPPMYAFFGGVTGKQYLKVNNAGATPIRPLHVILTGEGSMTLSALDGSWSYTLTEGTYIIPEIVCPVGSQDVCFTEGDATITGELEFEFSEARLS